MANDLIIEKRTATDGDYEAPELGIPGPTTSSRPPEVKPEPKAPEAIPQKLGETLEALNKSIRTETSAARLLADPQIRAYLDAKARGDNPVLSGAPAPKEPEVIVPKLPENLDTLSNTELVNLLNQQISTQAKIEASRMVKEQIGSLREEIAPKINTLLATTNQFQATEMQKEISAAKTKYKDFEDVRPKMVELSQSGVSGLSIDELYLMAKVRSGQPLVSSKEIESERPSTNPSQRREYKRSEVAPRGRGGFDRLIQDSLTSRLGESDE